tara:strand:+ start:441 stop:1058 length:618 start_codon:yes stop_codon:yes gene_type:complete
MMKFCYLLTACVFLAFSLFYVSGVDSKVLDEGVSSGFAPRSQLLNPRKAAEFTLTNQDGSEVSLAGLKGKVVLLAFIYTRCHEICPSITDQFCQIQKAFDEEMGKDLELVLISLDPRRDDPERCQKYTEAYEGKWFFLTGTSEQIDALLPHYQVMTRPSEQSEILHNWMVVLIDRNGYIRYRYMGEDDPQRHLVSDIKDLIGEDQ